MRKPGDRVEAGEPVVVLHVDDPDRLPAALAALEGAIEVAPEPPDPRPLVVERIALGHALDRSVYGEAHD